MKMSMKNTRGVTLLEVMLVLAIAAMIIIMSIRYYQTAQTNEQANAFVEQIQAIVSAADSMATATGSYTGGSVTTSTVTTMLPTGGMTTPWGVGMTLAATADTLTITVNGAVPVNVCTLTMSKLTANARFTVVSPCTTITYNAST